MPGHREAAEILKRAKEMLRSGQAGGHAVHKSGRVGQPIPVVGPHRDLHSWFVPVTVGDALAGFFEFQLDRTLARYSSFQRREDSLEGCPPAASWIDAKEIRHRVEDHARAGETVRELFLTYDRVPSRIAWAAVLESPDGTTRTLHIAGDVIWEAVAPREGETSFDGGRHR